MDRALSPIDSVAIGDNAEFLVNGDPFLPVMVWLQNPERFNDGIDIGVNTFVGNSRDIPARTYLDELQEKGLYGVVHFDPDAVGHPALLGWIHGDEPDLPREKGSPELRRTPAEVLADYEQIVAADPSRPVFLNFTVHFSKHFEFSRFKTDAERAIYGDFVKAADAVGFDIYPLYQRNRPDKLTWVADGVTDLRDFAGPRRALFAWIETNKGSKWIDVDKQRDPTPEEVRCEVWMAIIRGVQAIGYFPHSWHPDYSQFAIPPENREALRRIDGQITQLTPVLLAPPSTVEVEVQSEAGLPTELLVREHGGSLYIVVLNADMDRRGGEIVVRSDAIPTGVEVDVTEVLGGRRTLTSVKGEIRDTLDPLAVHIFRIDTPTRQGA